MKINVDDIVESIYPELKKQLHAELNEFTEQLTTESKLGEVIGMAITVSIGHLERFTIQLVQEVADQLSEDFAK